MGSYRISVWGLGTVRTVKDKSRAWKLYNEWVILSRTGYERAGNRIVRLRKGRQVLAEYRPDSALPFLPTSATATACGRDRRPGLRRG